MIPEAFTEVGVRGDLLLAGWIGLALLVITVIAGAVGHGWDNEGGLWAMIPGICAALVIVVWFVLLFPFRGEYHHVYRVQGNVQSVSNVLSEASGDLTRTPVIELDTIDRPITMTDPRAVTLEGKDVTLTCRIVWNYQAADTYECSIYSLDD